MSIVTATHGRRDLLNQRCIPSVDAQTYQGRLEHIVVADGPDESWLDVIACSGVTRRYVELGRNWRSFRRDASWGADPRLCGTLIARGDYIGYVDDDDALRPEHVAELVYLLEETGVDFVFSKMARPDRIVIGSGRPEINQIGTPMILHRAELLTVANWEPCGYAEDWHLVRRWLAAGATWAHLPQVTVDIWPHGATA